MYWNKNNHKCHLHLRFRKAKFNTSKCVVPIQPVIIDYRFLTSKFAIVCDDPLEM